MLQLMKCVIAILFLVLSAPTEAARPVLAPIIKIPPPESDKDLPYGELICTQEHQDQIAYIISTIASNSKVSLLFLQGDLKRAGAKINEVHPLKFLESIFANPALKEQMKEIENDRFKWSGFMDGLVPSLTNQANQGKLLQYLPDFAQRVGNAPEELISYFQSKDWDNLVRYLITH